ncbi:hypothetical protein [Ferrimonas balearica]|uniref:hypothetical protein n=1 Tax=Ferrimonas balearica TaxID=44012 RepID=UPI001F2FC6C5|nr:hypothetical protein [Ferrimonas balearica]MBY6093856.1 hypothetical protein [Ferrimonas balearica]
MEKRPTHYRTQHGRILPATEKLHKMAASMGLVGLDNPEETPKEPAKKTAAKPAASTEVKATATGRKVQKRTPASKKATI